MHAARLRRSGRLRRVHELLSDGLEHSTLEIVLEARVCAVNSIVAELRANGCAIECRQERGSQGGRIWLYRMTPSGPLPPTGEGRSAGRNKGGGGAMIRAKGRKGVHCGTAPGPSYFSGIFSYFMFLVMSHLTAIFQMSAYADIWPREAAER